MNEERIQELLLQWEEEYECGRDIPPEKLCRDDADIAKVLTDRIAALKQLRWLDQTGSESNASNDAHANVENFVLGESAVIADRYRLDCVVGQGAFGVVWKGYDLQLQRPVALKIPRRAYSPHRFQVEAFLVEARKLAQLNRHGIVPVYDVVPYHGSNVIVSEYIEGVNLSKYLEGNLLPVWDAVAYFAALARRLDHAHEQGIVHRDVKPANILVDTRRDLFITDFGVASTLDQGGSPMADDRRGTLPYMAPELLYSMPGRADARSDIYSLGVVFYQMLTGQLPFMSNDAVQLRSLIINGPWKSPGKFRRVPARVAAICKKCLARDPDDRFQSMTELANHIHCCIYHRHSWPFQADLKLIVAIFATSAVGLAFAIAREFGGDTYIVVLTLWALTLIITFYFGKITGRRSKQDDYWPLPNVTSHSDGNRAPPQNHVWANSVESQALNSRDPNRPRVTPSKPDKSIVEGVEPGFGPPEKSAKVPITNKTGDHSAKCATESQSTTNSSNGRARPPTK